MDVLHAVGDAVRTGGPAMLRMMSGPADHNAFDRGAMTGMDHGGDAGMAMGNHNAETHGEMPAQVTDPVCGMRVPPEQAAATSTYEGQTYYFCSPGDKQTFDRDPARYARVKTQGGGA